MVVVVVVVKVMVKVELVYSREVIMAVVQELEILVRSILAIAFSLSQ